MEAKETEEGGMLGRAFHGAGCYSFKAKQLQPHLRAHPKQSGSRDWIAAPMKDLTPIPSLVIKCSPQYPHDLNSD